MSPFQEGNKQVSIHQQIDSGRLPAVTGGDVVEEIHLARYRYAAQFVRGERVLDIATGIGYGASILSRQGGALKVTGVDVSEEAIRSAGMNYKSESMEFVRTDGGMLPFADGAFDVIVSFETIEHTMDQGFFLSELFRVLRRGGMIIISTPNKRFHSLGRKHPWNPFHAVEFLPLEFKTLVERQFAKCDFWGGQEFLSVTNRNILRYNWIEIKYYMLTHHRINSRLVLPVLSLKRALQKAVSSRKAGPGAPGTAADGGVIERRSRIVEWQYGFEPYTMIARCTKE